MTPLRRASALQGCLLCGLLVAGSASAQEPVAAPGRTALSGVFTTEQAEDGALLMTRSCADCHDITYFNDGALIDSWAGLPLRSLFKRIFEVMPESNPGSLKPAEYAAVLAYILQLNGFPAGEEKLPADVEKLREIMLVPRPEGGER